MPSGTKSRPRGVALVVVGLLNDERERQSVTQEYLAALTQISQSQLSRILAGTKSMTVTELFRMCMVLGLTASDLVAEAELRMGHR